MDDALKEAMEMESKEAMEMEGLEEKKPAAKKKTKQQSATRKSPRKSTPSAKAKLAKGEDLETEDGPCDDKELVDKMAGQDRTTKKKKKSTKKKKQQKKTKSGSDPNDPGGDDSDVEDDEDDIFHDDPGESPEERQAWLNRVKDANIKPATRYGYHLSQRRMVVYFTRHEEMSQRLLRPEVSDAILSLPEGRKLQTRKKKKAGEFVNLASKDFHPVNLHALTADDFLSYLLATTTSKAGFYRRSYGSDRSALMNLFVKCGVLPSDEFLRDLRPQ